MVSSKWRAQTSKTNFIGFSKCWTSGQIGWEHRLPCFQFCSTHPPTLSSLCFSNTLTILLSQASWNCHFLCAKYSSRHPLAPSFPSGLYWKAIFQRCLALLLYVNFHAQPHTPKIHSSFPALLLLLNTVTNVMTNLGNNHLVLLPCFLDHINHFLERRSQVRSLPCGLNLVAQTSSSTISKAPLLLRLLVASLRHKIATLLYIIYL